MHPARKFSQNNCKKKSIASIQGPNKENAKASITESFARKFSVGDHALSEQNDFIHHKKSIADQKISVFLQNSQHRTFAFEKPSNENDIRYLNRIMRDQDKTVLSILQQQMQKNEIKSDELRSLLCVMAERLAEEGRSEQNFEDSFRISDSSIRPILQTEMVQLEKNLSKLKTKHSELNQILELNSSQKSFLKKALLRLEEDQKQQLMYLDTM